MIGPSEGPALSAKLRAYISRGGSAQDAADIASTLNAAVAITDIIIILAPEFKIIPVGVNIWKILDRSNIEILRFRFTETSFGAIVNIL